MPGKHPRARSKFWSMEGLHKATGLRFESGLEKRFLDQCYMQGIKVARCKRDVRYQDSTGKWHVYHPDFEWPAFSFIIEIKGAWAFRDNHGHVVEKYYAAMRQFNNRYTIITGAELKRDFVARLHRALTEGRRIDDRI